MKAVTPLERTNDSGVETEGSPSLRRAEPSSGPLPLVVEDVHKRYRNGTWANRGISLQAYPGEVLGILGPNGAGKTTLVKQITTELLPTSGRVQVFGHDVAKEASAVKALLGVVPQEASPFEYLTVSQHLMIFAKLRGLHPRKARSRAEELMAELNLMQYRDTPMDKLSGGLRRRVLFGLAALAQPPIMVLDEPTTGLDPRSRRDIWSLVERHKDMGTAVLLTTHYMEEAEALCDRVGIIQHGRLLALDTIPSLRAAYGYEYKVTYTCNGSQAEGGTLHGADDRELVERARALGATGYSVARTSLEDVYLALTGEEEEDGDTD